VHGMGDARGVRQHRARRRARRCWSARRSSRPRRSIRT
jgi:hypothetical protein